MKRSLSPINDFVNNNTEEINNTLNRNTFFDEKTFNEKVAEFKTILKKEFINESFLLYDKSNTIKRTFITALNKELSIYGSFSYFSGKKSKKYKADRCLKPPQKAIRKNLKLHLAYLNGSVVQTKDKKIHNFSITRPGKRQKNMFSTPIDTIIISAQQVNKR